ncbi:MAG: PTS transporter subunit EIIC, partial [Selenomonadaceae bacterium]|nr:PTS transporter subunit EIIC [Selenomonadaceae bacterium]
HQKFYKIKLPTYLGFFSGSRFVPIICAVASISLGISLYVIWPSCQMVISEFGGLFKDTGYIGTLFYGFFLRMLGIFGLHHIFYLPFWTTGLGGTEIINGQIVEGTQRIFFAQLSDPNTVKYYEGISRFMSGRFITMMFGLIGAAFAMYKTAKPQNRKIVGGMLFSAALTSFLTGITEPLEFSFLFVAPWLYVLHAFFDGCAFMMAHIFQITIGQTFSGGLIDFILFGIAQGEDKTNWMYVPVIGVVWFFVYYFSFKFLIEKYDYKTPGRDEDLLEEKVLSDAEQTQLILSGLGGKGNISDLDCCITRLRVTVNDASLVSEEILKSSGAQGIIRQGVGVQIVYGLQVNNIKNNLEEALK